MEQTSQALITDDTVVIGLLMVILALVFWTHNIQTPFWKKFYTYIPSVLLCYFIPSVFTSLGVIDGEASNLYFVSSRYLLPTCLVLLTLSIDLKEIMKLGTKAVIMFFTGTVGVILGGPIAILIFSVIAPDIVGGVGPEAVWRGMTTVAGSWIGGSANQAAMLEIFGSSPEMFSKMIAVDVIVANIWMAFLLYGAGQSGRLDKLFKADATAIEHVQKRMDDFKASVAKIPTLTDIMIILGVGFGATSFSHWVGAPISEFIEVNFPYLEKLSLTSSFFWLVVIATTIGLILSFTKARNLEGAGASKLGSAMLYVLIASVGMRMNLGAILDDPGLFLVGIVWISIHVALLLLVAKLIKAPFFFTAVGSQANIGGAASAPVVAAAFSPSLAPVGVLLAVLGYAVGTYGAWLCGILMQNVAP